MYAKIFAQIYDGTLCSKGPWEALVTFQQFLILADQHGVVDLTLGAIARRTTITLDILEKGVNALVLPDPDSRTPTDGGRRITPLSDDRTWGWRVVNYEHYRLLKREADRREYHREHWRKRDAKTSNADAAPQQTQHLLNTTQQTQHDSTATQQTQHLLNTTQQTQPIAEAKAEVNRPEF